MKISVTKFRKILKQYQSVIVWKQFSWRFYIDYIYPSIVDMFLIIPFPHFALNARPKLAHWLSVEQNYGNNILHEMQKIICINLKRDPLSLLLGLSSDNLTSVANRRLFNILTLAARKKPSFALDYWQTPFCERMAKKVLIEYHWNILHA